jgi:DNA-3-methyladenine glycosylase II
MPARRADAVRALAGAVAAGALGLDGSQGLDALVTQLTALPGIGPWTAQYIAMRACGEPDAFPSGDLGLRRAAGNGNGPVDEATLEARSQAWRPWRAYAAMHLWCAPTTAGNGQTSESTRVTTSV